MKLIVGLGNPGREYARTRHNAGFLVLDRLVERWGLSWSAKFAGRFARGERTPTPAAQTTSQAASPEPVAVALLEPMTYMNLSGRSVIEAANFFKIAPADVLVIADDMHLDLGVLRLREAGSAGGHNGLKDIIRALGGQDFPRLRIGVGPFAGGESSSFVLGNFRTDEWERLQPELDRAADAAESWLLLGTAAAANRFNGRDSSRESSRDTSREKNEPTQPKKPKSPPTADAAVPSASQAAPRAVSDIESAVSRSNSTVSQIAKTSRAQPEETSITEGGSL